MGVVVVGDLAHVVVDVVLELEVLLHHGGQAVVEQVLRETRRTALICPEDNVAAFLASALRQAGVSVPQKAGVLSVMGTNVAVQNGLSCLRYDFRAMGRLAVEALDATVPPRHVLEPQLVAGGTT